MAPAHHTSYCTPTALTILYSYCTHYTVLMGKCHRKVRAVGPGPVHLGCEEARLGKAERGFHCLCWALVPRCPSFTAVYSRIGGGGVTVGDGGAGGIRHKAMDILVLYWRSGTLWVL
jgi:hypothetical protein